MMNTRTKWLSACLAAFLVASATPAAAQQGGQSAGQSPDHAGHQGRGHDAMQAREFRNLQQGRGMGMGRAAETNGYPGPMHVLQHVHRSWIAVGLRCPPHAHAAPLLEVSEFTRLHRVMTATLMPGVIGRLACRLATLLRCGGRRGCDKKCGKTC